MKVEPMVFSRPYLTRERDAARLGVVYKDLNPISQVRERLLFNELKSVIDWRTDDRLDIAWFGESLMQPVAAKGSESEARAAVYDSHDAMCLSLLNEGILLADNAKELRFIAKYGHDEKGKVKTLLRTVATLMELSSSFHSQGRRPKVSDKMQMNRSDRALVDLPYLQGKALDGIRNRDAGKWEPENGQRYRTAYHVFYYEDEYRAKRCLEFSEACKGGAGVKYPN